MRVGTWNLEGRWTANHQRLLEQLECDLWLLTEVRVGTDLSGYTSHTTAELMSDTKHWAAVLSRSESDLVPLPDPHPATARCMVEGLQVLSSVLPWNGCGARWPGLDLADKMELTLSSLEPVLGERTLWGGDWNQAFEGKIFVGTHRGRALLTEVIRGAQMVVPTALLASANPGHRSIDHIAVSAETEIRGARHVSAVGPRGRLSDHDAYVVELDWP
jgi:hypothetical protein